MLKKLPFFIFILSFTWNTNAQNTVGTVLISEDVFEAYTLISVHNNAYLLNNCGQVVNEWSSAYLPGNSVYLLPNGNLLRAGRVEDGSSNIVFGGQGGVVELFDWDGNLLWSFLYNNNQQRQHHDVFPMPNGNVLILAATAIPEAEAINLGRDPNLIVGGRLYNEQIIEVEPVGSDQANVVWEWNVKDHIVQDFDNTKITFGDVGMTPEKLDINFLNGIGASENWLHFNSIQYNANLDQIVISSRNLSEIYIIDHSTTTAEAATSSGGIYGKGGDFLYRWGNPQAYRQGTATDRILYGQHYPYFIEDGLVDAGKIIVFNNGNGRTPEYSEAAIFEPPKVSPGVYAYTPNTAYGPTSFEYSYSEQTSDPSDFYSAILSSAQRLPNGNMLICEGRTGEVFEIDAADNIVWKYINPIDNNTGSSIVQGDPPMAGNLLFRAIKYAPDFPGLVGRDLTPGATLEFNPDLTECESLSVQDVAMSNVTIFPNPTSHSIQINSQFDIDLIEVYSLVGQKVIVSKNQTSIDLSNLDSGVYFIKVYSDSRNYSQRIIKQ
ncbi:aryl-sulfate sulfotransferase [Psychroserpens sp. BH13MA-6]